MSSIILKAVTKVGNRRLPKLLLSFSNPEAIISAISNLVIVFVFYAVGVGYYNAVEGWSVEDCIYFLTVTISTVGYGDFGPTNDKSRVFTIFVILVGLIFIFSIINEFAMWVVETASKRAEELTKGKSLDDIVNDDPYKYYKKYGYTIGTIGLMVLLGSLFFWQNEESWTFVMALYWTICTTTTVGYGDLSLTHDSSRLFLIFYIPISVCVVAASLGALSSIEIERKAEEKRIQNLTRKLNFDMIREMDKDGDGVDKTEFLIAMLVQNEICDFKKDIEPWLKRFDELDADGSGKLDEEDIRILEEQENEKQRQMEPKIERVQQTRGSVVKRPSVGIETAVVGIILNPLNTALVSEREEP